MKIIVKNCIELLEITKVLEEKKYFKLFDGVYSKTFVTDDDIVIRVFVE